MHYPMGKCTGNFLLIAILYKTSIDLFRVYIAISDCLPIGSNTKVTPPKTPEIKAMTKLACIFTAVVTIVFCQEANYSSDQHRVASCEEK